MSNAKPLDPHFGTHGWGKRVDGWRRQCSSQVTAPGEVLNLPRILSRILCVLGLHDFRLVERILSFGCEGGVEKVQCRRCGLTITRHG